MFRRNTSGQIIGFALISASTGAALTGATVTVYRSIDGGAQAAAAGTVSEKGNGQYVFSPTAADLDGGQVSFLFVATGAVLEEKTVVTTAANPGDSQRFGLTALPASGTLTLPLDAAGTRSAVGLASANLDTQISLLATASALTSVATNVTAILDDTGTSGVVVASASKTGYALGATGLDAIVVETGLTAKQALSVIAAGIAGTLSGAGTGTILIKGANVATTRITATTDASGNRSAIVLTLP